MFYSNNIQDIRQFFFATWHKYHQKQPLLSLEQQIIAVMLEHSEYHAVFNATNPEERQEALWALGQNNPFLHMGLHLTIRDQIATNKPLGIQLIYSKIMKKQGSQEKTEHLLMEPLTELLWEAQSTQQIPNEQFYLERCRQLI